MKLSRRFSLATLALSGLAVGLGGCASSGFLNPRPSVTLYGPALPSRDKGAEVEMFQTQRPERPYSEIARIETTHGDDAWGMKQILAKARELGADGVIVVGSTRKAVEQVPGAAQNMTVVRPYGISAIALRFR
jgi:hypothetical protein